MQASKQQYGAKSVTLAYQTLAEEKRREDIYRFRGPSSFSPSESPNEQSASKLETKSSDIKMQIKKWENIFIWLLIMDETGQLSAHFLKFTAPSWMTWCQFSPVFICKSLIQ